MVDRRASKRRRVSNVDEEGDMEMRDVDNAKSTSPTTPTRSSRQRPSRSTQKTAQDDEQAIDVDTPSRVGVRSSGRQRKTPRRYEQEVTPTRTSARRATAAQRDTLRSTRGTSQASEEDQDSEEEAELEEEEDDDDEEAHESPQPRKSQARTRSKRDVKSQNQPEEQGKAEQTGTPENDQDGIDDLVAMHLQKDLVQPGLDGKDDAAPPAEPLPGYAEQFQSLVESNNSGEDLRVITQVVLEKLNGKRGVPLKGLDTEYHKVHHLIEQTVTSGEGNSMLVLGSRGSGKTTIVETALSSLAEGHANDFHVVRLNGFLHTDDRLALREMWRQLGREMNTEEEAGKVSSYADTMATLLALLSHPEELFGPSDGHTNGLTTAKSVVILLDEFDLFVSHPRQTLLYNLFDIAQARKAPVAVIGITTKVDVTEMLEKRVKSRFSHRYIFVPLPRSIEMFSDICFAGLDFDDSEISSGNSLAEGWSVYLTALFNDEAFRSHLLRIYHQTKSVKEFFTSALLAMSELHHSTYTDNLSVPVPKTFATGTLSCADPAPFPFHASTTVSASPSSLPLSLLLAATRLAALYDPSTEPTAQPQSMGPLALSFGAAYTEYVRLLTSAKTSASVHGATATPGRVWGRDVAREAWEKLVGWGLVSPVGGGSGTADGRMFRVEVSFEEVVEIAGSGGSLGRWWRDH